MKAAASLVALVCVLAACERQMQDMYRQPKILPLRASPLWEDGRGSRPLPAHTIAYSGGAIADASSGRMQIMTPSAPGVLTLPIGPNGEVEVSPLAGPVSVAPASNPFPITLDLLQRGRERFGIFCAPCHGFAGYGDGMVARRGFPSPPSYHTDRLRKAPDAHFFNVITNGYGAMYPYADRVPANDRWAIVAYIRALQLSQHATLDQVPPEQRRLLQNGRP